MTFTNLESAFFCNKGISDRDEKIIEALSQTPISEISLKDDVLTIDFEDDCGFTISDGGQSCCESRYMHCEDESDFDHHKGSYLRFIQVVDGEDVESEYHSHEIQFCNILTSRGVIQLVCHNEHNGYYGGFAVQIGLL